MTSSTRYRHPGDVIRLICSGGLLIASLVAVVVFDDRLLGPSATLVTDAIYNT